MVFKWRDEHMIIFLEHFKRHECLWNHRLAIYKDRNKRAKAITSLKNDTNIEGVTEEDIKLKIKTIRTKYSAEATKVKNSTKSGCSTDEIYVPKIFWYNQADEFLNGICNHRSSTSNLDNIRGINQLSEEGENEQSQVESAGNIHTNINTDGASFQVAGSSQSIPTAPNTQRAAINSRTSNRKRLNVASIDTAIKELRAINEENQEDEFDLFCKSLAIQLKKMPLSRALICQEKLQSVMVQERISSMVMQSPTSGSNYSTYSNGSRSNASNYSFQMSPSSTRFDRLSPSPDQHDNTCNMLNSEAQVMDSFHDYVIPVTEYSLPDENVQEVEI